MLEREPGGGQVEEDGCGVEEWARGLESRGADVAVGDLYEGGEAVVVDFGAEGGDALLVEFETPDFAVLLVGDAWVGGFGRGWVPVEDCSCCCVREGAAAGSGFDYYASGPRAESVEYVAVVRCVDYLRSMG